MAKKTPKQKCTKKCNVFCSVLKMILSPTIPTYFLWSGLLYIAATITIFMLSGAINRHLCDIYVPAAKCADCPSSDLLMCSKSSCYQNAMNITITTEAALASDLLFAQLKASSSDWHCMNRARESDDPVQMAIAMADTISGSAFAEDSISIDCVSFNCAVLMTAISHQDLVLTPKSATTAGCTNSAGSKQSWDDSNCVCSGLFQTMTHKNHVDIESMCRFSFPNTTTTTTTTITTTAIGTYTRRMQAAYDVEPLQEPEVERRLSHVPPTQAPADAAINDGLPEYTQGTWSQCTCYQACNGGENMVGIMSRRVKCMSSKCKAPMPEVSKTCHCIPCADCTISLELLIVMIVCIVEGVLCLIMWMSICYMSSVVSVSEANLVSLSWGQWFLGFFISQFPLLIRLGVLANAALAIFFMVVTFVPEDVISFQNDCKNISSLWVLSIFFPVLVFVLLVVGALMRHFKRMEPYLFRPVRESSAAPIRIVAKFLRSLGP